MIWKIVGVCVCFLLDFFRAKIKTTPTMHSAGENSVLNAPHTSHHTHSIYKRARAEISLSVHRVHYIRYLQNCILYFTAKRNATSECLFWKEKKKEGIIINAHIHREQNTKSFQENSKRFCVQLQHLVHHKGQ